ncbi:MAG TPA: heme-binding protein [Terracidiphilus sp.]|nr:heme-binding protein [Terracidiphilus sp.]
MINTRILSFALAMAASLTAVAQPSLGTNPAQPDCKGLPSHIQLRAALTAVVNVQGGNGGFGLNMWGTVVNRDGIVCAVVFTGANRGDQWPGSRVISAQKASTANAFSLPKLALSTAQLYSAVQPGGSLYGLQASNPVNTQVAYGGNGANFGQINDPMVGGRIGGVNVFGGGLALYNKAGVLLGGLGVSGDSSCADHNIAWRTRHKLELDFVPGGVGPDTTHPDNIIYDITPASGLMSGVSTSGWGHPVCSAAAETIAGQLPPVR